MKNTIYTLGLYSFNPEEPFKTVDEAVAFIQERHPEVTKEAIETRLKPKIKDHEPDKSGNVSETTGKSGKDVAKPGKGGDK